MGCFSYICKECQKPVLSDSFSGEPCRIYRLENGKVVQEMHGDYDSYGSVFNENKESSLNWNGNWSEHVSDHFDNNEGTGFVIIHEECFSGKIPSTISDDDPNQGWGDIQTQGVIKP